jgi:hypothetical protein
VRTLSAFLLLLLVAAGCAGSSPTRAARRGLPPVLAHAWATQAATVAAAAATGNSCRARRLANSLRTEVISAGGRVPARLQDPLLEAVNSLADRITCVPPVMPSPPQGPPKPGKGPKPKPPKHDDHGHGPGGDG